MPKYEFIRGGHVEEYTVPMGEIEKLTSLLSKGGWKRVFTSPQIYIQLDYENAYEESVQEAAKADAQAEAGRRESAVSIADAMIEEWGH